MKRRRRKQSKSYIQRMTAHHCTNSRYPIFKGPCGIYVLSKRACEMSDRTKEIFCGLSGHPILSLIFFVDEFSFYFDQLLFIKFLCSITFHLPCQLPVQRIEIGDIEFRDPALKSANSVRNNPIDTRSSSTMIGGRTAYSRTSAGGGMVRPGIEISDIQIGDRAFKSANSCQKFRRGYLRETQTPTPVYCRVGAVDQVCPGSCDLLGDHSSRRGYCYSNDVSDCECCFKS
jgi:hypothetical protein